jgi:anti-sigma factor RsiW
MNNHDWFEDLLPQYAAGGLDESLRHEVRMHVETCRECQADLRLWMALSDEIRSQNHNLSAPPSLVEEVLKRVEGGQHRMASDLWSHLGAVLRREFDLLRIQAPLVRRELWPASALVILIGLAVAYMIGNSIVIRVVAPLVAAASLSVIYGPGNDPAIELVLSCPTSPRQILLARVVLVFGYNLALALFAAGR